SLGHKDGESSLRDALEEIMEADIAHDAPISPEEKAILQNALSLGTTKVGDIMTPRANIVAVQHGATLADIQAAIAESEHTRLPVYKENLDDIIGFIHVKDLFKHFAKPEAFRVSQVMRELVVVPPSMKVVDLLVRMRKSGTHLALVVDEYGGTDGLVSLEDIFEEIVGEIQDEHDDAEEEAQIAEISPGVFEADARVELEKLEDVLKTSVAVNGEEPDYHTLGGMIFALLGRVPDEGESMIHPKGFSLDILSAEPRRIGKVRIRL
ncbi:MAG: HlyC/CorC family transporter, partial [Alphaproteobacteria bacterium]|nr:HlyC/CorC family transporter [Alphaproteobacteria bacterium]